MRLVLAGLYHNAAPWSHKAEILRNFGKDSVLACQCTGAPIVRYSNCYCRLKGPLVLNMVAGWTRHSCYRIFENLLGTNGICNANNVLRHCRNVPKRCIQRGARIAGQKSAEDVRCPLSAFFVYKMMKYVNVSEIEKACRIQSCQRL